MPGTRARAADVRGQTRHVGELLVAAIPRARRPLCPFRAPGCHPSSITANGRLAPAGDSSTMCCASASDRVGAVLAVRPVPVVASVDRLRRQPRIRAHLPAERVNRGERRFARTTARDTDVAHVERALAELHAGAATPHVGPEADALRVDMPEAECARAGANAVRVRERAVMRREVPRHDAIGHPRPPLEIAVPALPCVAEDQTHVGHAAAPAKVDPLDRGRGSRQRDVKRAGVHSRRDEETLAVRPALARVVPKRLLAVRRLRDHEVRRAQQVEKAALRHPSGRRPRETVRR